MDRIKKLEGRRKMLLRAFTIGNLDNPKTAEAEAPDARIIPAPARRAGVLGTIDPATATQHAVRTAARPLRIVARAFAVIFLTVPIGTQFPDVSGHIVNAQTVGLLLAYYVCFIA